MSEQKAEWPEVVLWRDYPAADPENYKAYHPDNGPATPEAERYVPASSLTQHQFSDEDRELLEEMASEVENRFNGAQHPGSKAQRKIDLLRMLASQQPVEGGREREELTMIALALKNEGIEDCTPEEGVEQLVTLLASYRASQPQQHGEVEEDAEPCSTCGKVGGDGVVPAPDSERCPTASMVPCPACGEGKGI